jgi:hypothetical protein
MGLRELAEAQTRVALPPPPDAAAGWETCAASRLEWDAQAAAPIDLLFLAYTRWCAAHGELVLAEEPVLAWLTAHGATVGTGSGSRITAVESVRIVD